VNDTSGGTDFLISSTITKTDIATDQILMSIVVLKDASEFTSQLKRGARKVIKKTPTTFLSR
jgi:hypothetical protein